MEETLFEIKIGSLRIGWFTMTGRTKKENNEEYWFLRIGHFYILKWK